MNYAGDSVAEGATAAGGDNTADGPPLGTTGVGRARLMRWSYAIRACAVCQRKTRKYGHGGTPLCPWCAAPVLKQRGPHVRQLSARP